MITQENRITEEDKIKADNLARSGWEAVSGKGAEWQQAVLREELSMEDALTLAIGQLQASCYVLKMFLQHAQPRDLVATIAQEVASSAYKDILSAVKGQPNAEQRNQDGSTPQDLDQAVS